MFDSAEAALADDPPVSDVLQLDLNRQCAMVDSFSVDDRALELVGSATALFGDVGDRYQCAWSGDVEGPANVRFEVVFIDEGSDFVDYVDLVNGREGNEIVETPIGAVAVASFTPEAGGLPVVTAVLADETRQAGVQLVVELVDPALRDGWIAADYAGLLANFGQ